MPRDERYTGEFTSPHFAHFLHFLAATFISLSLLSPRAKTSLASAAHVIILLHYVVYMETRYTFS